ncbi:sigma-70 family RNA polymerase sigma factor [Thalassotalea sp. PP2-459]|uniref:sigma-70 family RNA polymerase sigma factor n=1 Tax=Thalassotalea sp. PP2-459 TaxID=1742724 RepID=UPI000945281D|nr:sigma-70 family RNA polymerase sigma factor [Thalassotalea sp. PP2-459]OKY27907.1 RNA polymerase subunit sigma [Thalassotalea sp. PP2-459]
MVTGQISLSVTASSVKPKAMIDSTEHQQLSQWLISVANHRDKAAFSELFKFFAPKILRIAKNKIGSEAQASEIVQETMSNIWRKAHLFDAQKGAPTTWVYTVMRNVTFDMLRKVKSNREDTLSDDIWPLAEQSASEDEPFEDHLAQNNILSVIETLPENQQQVIKGFYFMEMSQEQLANHLGLPLGTIKSRLRLALAKLKAQLGEHHD